jgi:hypothetical protein
MIHLRPPHALLPHIVFHPLPCTVSAPHLPRPTDGTVTRLPTHPMRIPLTQPDHPSVHFFTLIEVFAAVLERAVERVGD